MPDDRRDAPHSEPGQIPRGRSAARDVSVVDLLIGWPFMTMTGGWPSSSRSRAARRLRVRVVRAQCEAAR